MKKKLMCLFLSAAMLLGMLAGCSSSAGDEEDVEAMADIEESSRISMTLSLWLPTDENTTEEAIELTEAAINKLTQSKYDTAIELHAIPRDEYQTAIDARMAEIEKIIEEQEIAAEEKRKQAKELQEQGITETEEEESETKKSSSEETYVNDLGITVIKYPDVADTQMDIFLVQGYDNYKRYIEEEQIQQLDSELSGSSKILKTYIYPTFLTLANENGTYAIPNNHPVGEYQYLLINKELVEKYDYDVKSLTTLLKCQDFIKDMGYLKDSGEEALADVTPLLGEVEAANMKYWSLDGSWSVIASAITNSMSYNTKCAPKSIFSITAYTNTVTLMKELKEAGWVGDGVIDEGEKFAVGVVAGDASVAEKYGDEYYVSIYARPTMTNDDVYGAMFAVSSYSKSLSRSMEIITYLNTSSDIRTILQYGVEDVHWQYNKENPEVIDVISDDYSMNLLETGNVYMTYPGAGIPMSYWEYGKQQNLDSITSPFMKFGESYVTDENKAKLEELADLSNAYKERIDAMSAAEFKDAVATFKSEVKENELMTELLDDEEVSYAIAYIYNDFFQSNYGG